MASRDRGGVDGLALVDKAAAWTSHDVVAKARGLLGTRRVGHAGTLDPDATGLLVLGVGRVTRLLKYLSGLDKEYRGEIVLGTSTSTLDAAGDVTGTWEMSAVTVDEVRAAAATLTGDIMQVPPMVSALKVGGQRLHDLARRGIEVDRDARPVRVERFDVGEPTAPGVFPIEVRCSSGTYVRVLAADVGAALGGGAHLRALRRTSVGGYGIDEAVTLDELAPEALLPPVDALRGRPVVEVDEALAADVGHGKVLPAEALGVEPAATGPWAIVDAGGALLAVYERHRAGTVKPGVVLPPL